MADNVSMSLDDIIKKKKKERQQKQVKGKGKGIGVKGFRTKPVRGSPRFQGRVARNFTFKAAAGGRQGKMIRPLFDPNRGNTRYFKNSLPMNQNRPRGTLPFNRTNNRGFVNMRNTPKRLNINPRPNQQYFRNYEAYETPGPSRQQAQFIPGRNQRGRRTWAYNGVYENLISPGRFATRKIKFQLARQRVQRARNVIASRIARNVGTLGQLRRTGQVNGSGRIVVGRFGLMTTRKANLGQYRANIQQKIQRAQMARQGQGLSNSPMFRGVGRRQENLGAIPQDVRASYPSRRGRFARQERRDIRQGSQTWSQNYVRGSPEPRSGGFRRGGFENNEKREDEWSIRMRRVENTPQRRSSNADFDRGEARVSSGLDPKIQSHISYIQEQGRRLRGEDKYDISPPGTPTVSVSYSSMSLSDRFKRFMN